MIGKGGFFLSHKFGIIFGTVLVLFTTFAALDTFVIPHEYATVDEEDYTYVIEQTSAPSDTAAAEDSTDASPVITFVPVTTAAETEPFVPVKEPSSLIGEYSDENIKITLSQYREYNSDIYVADVILSSPDYLKTAFAKNKYGTNVVEKTSSIAKSHNAILAINGDYYGARQSGYVIRNGKVYRSTVYRTFMNTTENLLIYGNGDFSILTEGTKTADALVAEGVKAAFCFGPSLLKDGNITVSMNTEVGQSMASNPRTVIAEIGSGDLHYLLVVSDGRTNTSSGVSLYQMASFLQSLGATTAYNLDGGGSSTLYFNGQVINYPTTNGRYSEREVSDIVYVGY